MKVSGSTIMPKARASSIIQLEMYTMGTGATIKRMGTEFISTRAALIMKAPGRTICNMAKELRLGWMAQDMKVNITSQIKKA